MISVVIPVLDGLVEEYEPDVLQLMAQWPQIDETMWPDFAHLA